MVAIGGVHWPRGAAVVRPAAGHLGVVAVPGPGQVYGGRAEGCAWTVSASPRLVALSGKVRVGGSAGMAFSRAPIFGGGREGGSWFLGPRKLVSRIRAGASGIGHPRSRVSALSLSWTSALAILPAAGPRALLSAAWIPEAHGPKCRQS